MIVRVAGDGVQLITQPDHARLARTIMEHCDPLAGRGRRAAILRAIEGHDDGWAEEDAVPTVDPATGQVIDFVGAPLSVRHAVWPRGVARFADEPWVAALIAQHAITVYDRFRADAAWTSFFTGMERLREKWVREAGLPMDELLSDYAFVRLGDLISLTFCTGWSNRQQFAGWSVELSGTRIVVGPDPFRGVTVPIAIGARELPRGCFRDDADLQTALRNARTVTLRGEAAGQAG